MIDDDLKMSDEAIKAIEDSVVALKRLNTRLELLSQEDISTNQELRELLAEKEREIVELKFKNEFLSREHDKLISGGDAAGRAIRIYCEMGNNPDYKRDEELFTPQDLIDLMGWIFSGDEKYLKELKEEWGCS